MLHTLHSIADWILKMQPTANRAFIVDGARMVHDQICRADLWKFRLTESYITSVADYSTGAADFTQGLATVAGATTNMSATANPVADITSGGTVAFSVTAYVSSTNTVTVRVCGTGTPTSTSYAVRVK